MTKFKKIGYVICLVLLSTAFAGLLVQPIALAASKDIGNIPTLHPAQESQEKAEIVLSSKYPTLTSQAGSGFEFEVELSYRGSEEPRVFDLTAEVPNGFDFAIARTYGGGTDIAAIKLDSKTAFTPEKIKVTVMPYFWLMPDPGEYTITVKATSGDIKGSVDLKGVITAKYDLALETPDGLLNTKVTTGKDNYFSAIVKNSGTAELDKINFKSKVRGVPSGWSVTFNPDTIDSLPVGSEREVEINIKPPQKTIAGDYEITITSEPESKYASDSLDIRVTVMTPTIWGWVGVGIVLVVVIGLVFMFMRLGRR